MYNFYEQIRKIINLILRKKSYTYQYNVMYINNHFYNFFKKRDNIQSFYPPLPWKKIFKKNIHIQALVFRRFSILLPPRIDENIIYHVIITISNIDMAPFFCVNVRCNDYNDVFVHYFRRFSLQVVRQIIVLINSYYTPICIVTERPSDRVGQTLFLLFTTVLE